MRRSFLLFLLATVPLIAQIGSWPPSGGSGGGGSADGTFTVNQGTSGSGLRVYSTSPTQALGVVGDAATGTGFRMTYDKPTSQATFGASGASDSSYWQNGSTTTNRIKLDGNGQAFFNTPASPTISPLTTKGLILTPVATDPGCTASYMVGKFWVDNTTNPTIVKTCSTNAAGTFFWQYVNLPIVTPASSAATCAVGTLTQDTGFIYVCTAANTWKRAALTTF